MHVRDGERYGTGAQASLPARFALRSVFDRLKWDDGHDSHKIRHGVFKWLRQIELATNASSSEKVGSIHFATLFEIMATWRSLYKLPINNELQITLDRRE